MTKASQNIRAIGLGTERILHPGDKFSSSDYKTRLTHNLITLTAKEVRGCVVIPDDDIQDNIEGDAFVDHIMQMVTKQIANELDEAYWIGDTHNLSSFGDADIRSIFDGWRYRVTHAQVGGAYYNDVSGASHILDATDGGTAAAPSTTKTFKIAGKIAEQSTAAPYSWEFKWGKARRTLPAIYKKEGLADLRYFTNDQVEQDFIDALASRNTNIGDAALTGASLSPGKIPVVSCPLLTSDLDASGILGAGSYTDVMLTHKNNLIIGIYKEIEMETERQPADRATYFYYTLRADLAIENVAAIVLIKNLTTG
ncbi:hypothetical protein ES705_35241 [subsurface metagenome]